MARNLYRVAFGISSVANAGRSVQSLQHVLIETFEPYFGTETQIELFKNITFESKLLKNCIALWQVHYISTEAIPDVPQTKDIKPDLIIAVF